MTDDEAVNALDNICLDDPEKAHRDADDILLDTLDYRVRDAYTRVRSDGFNRVYEATALQCLKPYERSCEKPIYHSDPCGPKDET